MSKSFTLTVYRAFWARDFTRVITLVDECDGHENQGQKGVRLEVMAVLSRINLGHSPVDVSAMKALFLQLKGSLKFSLGYAISLQCKYRQDFSGARRYLNRISPLVKSTSPLKQVYLENEKGNLDLVESYFESALEHYRAAEEALASIENKTGKKVPDLFRVVQLDNTGYIHLLLGDKARGVALIKRALTMAKKAELWPHLAECYQDLAFASGLDGQWSDSIWQAEKGLELTDKGVPQRVQRNLLVLLGQGLIRSDLPQADSRLIQIQQDLNQHFPGKAVADMLRIPGLVSAINLKA